VWWVIEKKINFLEDKWLREIPLKESIPRVYVNAVHKYTKILKARF